MITFAPPSDAFPIMSQLFHFPGRIRTVNMNRVQYQLLGTAVLDDTRGTIVPVILQAYHHNIKRGKIEILLKWIQDEVICDFSWCSFIGVLHSTGCE